MGTRRVPGKYDCSAAAEDDEPQFTLLGRDPAASSVVLEWVSIREEEGQTSQEKLDEAKQCAAALQEWARKIGKHSRVEKIAKQKKLENEATRQLLAVVGAARAYVNQHISSRQPQSDAFATLERLVMDYERARDLAP